MCINKQSYNRTSTVLNNFECTFSSAYTVRSEPVLFTLQALFIQLLGPMTLSQNKTRIERTSVETNATNMEGCSCICSWVCSLVTQLPSFETADSVLSTSTKRCSTLSCTNIFAFHYRWKHAQSLLKAAITKHIQKQLKALEFFCAKGR